MRETPTGAGLRPGSPLPRPSLRRNVFWTLTGYGVYMACQWAMLIVVARLGSPEKVGELALGIALSAPVVLFTNLGLRKVQVTDVRGLFEFADYFGLRLVMTAVALGIVAAVAMGAHAEAAAAAAILAVGLSKAVEATSDVVYGVLQQAERMERIAASLALRGLAGVGALALILALTRSVALGMLGVSGVWILVFVFHDLVHAKAILGARALRPRFQGGILARLAWVALPLGIVTPLVAMLSTVPAVMIEKLRGAGELGIYTALAYSYLASNRIASAMGEAASARLAAYYAHGQRSAFARVVGGLLILSGGVGVLGLGLALLAGRPLLQLLYGPAYAARSDILVGFMLVAVAGNLAVELDYSMTAMRRLRIQPLLAGVAVVVLAGLSAELIPRIGLRGAVVALGCVSLFQGVATLGVVVQGWMRFPPLAEALAPREA